MKSNGNRHHVRLVAAAGLLAFPLTLAACGNDEPEEAATPPAVATTEASPEIGDITDDYFGDASYVGRTVTVSGMVTEVVSPSAFVLAGQQYGDESLLVVSAPKMEVQAGQEVDVTGVVRQFGYDTYVADYELGPDAAAYTDFGEEEFLVVGDPAAAASGPPAASMSPSPNG